MLSSWPFGPEASPGHCLDFANTVSSRGSENPRDWVTGIDVWIRWCRRRGIFSETDAAFCEDGEALLSRIRDLREAIFEIFSAVASGAEPQIGLLNRELSGALLHVRLGADRWSIEGLGETAESGLWPVAVGAALLVCSPERSRIRECANHECGWLFLDNSKNRSRKWCDMSDCGNLAKAKRYYERHKKNLK